MRIELLLGSKNRVKVLRTLLRHDGVSGRQVGRMAGLSPSAANTTLGELVDSGLVLRNGSPGKHIYVVNRGNYYLGSLEKLFAVEENMLGTVASTVRRHLSALPADCKLLGIGINEAGALSIAANPVPDVTSSALRPLETALQTQFNLKLSKAHGEVSAITDLDLVWLPSADKGADKTSRAALAKVLEFFGLDNRTRLVRTDAAG